MTTHTTIELGQGRRRAWKAPNGQRVVLPVVLTAWEEDDFTGETIATVTAKVDLVDGRPQTVNVMVDAPEGLDTDGIQRHFRWATPADVVRVWMPDVMARGGDPMTEQPPSNWWTASERQELTVAFLEEIAKEYVELGYGYANVLASKYETTPRTVRSWVDKAKRAGIVDTSAGRRRRDPR
jgi:hypothetical protein